MSSGSPDPESAEKPLSRAQKKNARKKQKKKEKKASEVAFEIEEITTGFEEVSLGEKPPKSTSEAGTTEAKKDKVSTKYLALVGRYLPSLPQGDS